MFGLSFRFAPVLSSPRRTVENRRVTKGRIVEGVTEANGNGDLQPALLYDVVRERLRDVAVFATLRSPMNELMERTSFRNRESKLRKALYAGKSSRERRLKEWWISRQISLYLYCVEPVIRLTSVVFL